MITLTEEIIKDINKEITSEGVLIKNSISSCLVSWEYYETLPLKISSVVRSIIKNHYFKDGNKRTAFAVFTILCWANNLELKSKNWDSIFIDIASNNYNVEKISKMLFE